MDTDPKAGSTLEKSLSIRGPLRYQITTSSPQLEAGTKFSIYTRITNPYDVPVKITSVTTLLPVEFIDAALLEKTARRRKIVETMNSVQGYDSRQNIWPGLFGRKKSSEPVRTSTEAVTSMPAASPMSAVDIISDSDPYSVVQLIRTSDDQEATKNEALRQLRQGLKMDESEKVSETQLQPGNSIINVFTLKTTRSIFFPPNTYQSSVRIEYEIDLNKNIDVADYQLNIRAPLKAILYGALVGSVFGFFLRDLTGNNPMTPVVVAHHDFKTIVPYILALITSMMIAGIVVVAFARKKDAQPILSVEDFWGGIFVGFLAGYTGKPFLERALGSGVSKT